MKQKNIETLVAFKNKNLEYKPVKNAISEELSEIISKVYQLDATTGESLHFLTNIMMEYFHEDVLRVTWGELSPIELNLNGVTSRIEKARLVLSKNGYKDEVEVGNPMWYLKLAIQEIEHVKTIVRKKQG